MRQTFNRGSDFCARYGGEEFVVILSRTKDIATLTEKCRKNIEQLKIPHKDSKVSEFVTISIGVNTIIPDNKSDITNFIENADLALYRAKETGRNKFCLA
ncbi:MAG: diguanylate cyclase [Gammaproteobacteria bacterium]|nr:diguanylate cyclase [Gammaproteobacteria bacterium]